MLPFDPISGLSSLPSFTGGAAGPSNAQADADSGNISGIFQASSFAVGSGAVATSGDPSGSLTGIILPVVFIGAATWLLVTFIRR